MKALQEIRESLTDQLGILTTENQLLFCKCCLNNNLAWDTLLSKTKKDQCLVWLDFNYINNVNNAKKRRDQLLSAIKKEERAISKTNINTFYCDIYEHELEALNAYCIQALFDILATESNEDAMQILKAKEQDYLEKKAKREEKKKEQQKD